MTQNSGVVTIDNGSWLYLGMTSGSNGIYNLTGGTLNPSAREIVGNSGWQFCGTVLKAPTYRVVITSVDWDSRSGGGQ